jgi:hypothetical protein
MIGDKIFEIITVDSFDLIERLNDVNFIEGDVRP